MNFEFWSFLVLLSICKLINCEINVFVGKTESYVTKLGTPDGPTFGGTTSGSINWYATVESRKSEKHKERFEDLELHDLFKGGFAFAFKYPIEYFSYTLGTVYFYLVTEGNGGIRKFG